MNIQIVGIGEFWITLVIWTIGDLWIASVLVGSLEYIIMLKSSFPYITGSTTNLVKNNLLSNGVLPYASIIAGILVCKVVCHEIKSFPFQLFCLHVFLFIQTIHTIICLMLGFLVGFVVSFLHWVYDLTQLFSALYFKSYGGLNRVQKIEWSNRLVFIKRSAFWNNCLRIFVIISYNLQWHLDSPCSFHCSYVFIFRILVRLVCWLSNKWVCHIS